MNKSPEIKREQSGRPTEHEIQMAQYSLHELCEGVSESEVNGLYYEGLRDVVSNRDTRAAQFYTRYERLASIANHAYDRPSL